jgi:hypothetical protein
MELAGVGMVKGGDSPGFLLEALGEFFVRDFNGYITAKTGVASTIDFAHPARADGRQRPLGVAALEDKIVQQADNLSHEWAIKFMEHRVADRRILRLIQNWLKAGVSEDGQWSESKVGTPQGAVVSSLLANVYLHHVFDLWIDAWRKKVAVGEVIVVRCADDLVVGFESRTEAERFLATFRERLVLHAEKTRLIEFGQFAERNRKRRGEGKPETFTFLGFTHYCGKRRSNGTFIV